ncbi:MAG TPA: hypothetical protein EYH40_00005 [Desulfurococcales archaeon]|nr:hypothetical protein [Desulfurococcales archaeon]
MSGVATIAVHAVLFDGNKSYSRIKLSLLPIIYAKSLPDSITARKTYVEQIVVPYRGFYSSIAVPKVLSLEDIETLMSLDIPPVLSYPPSNKLIPLKPVNEIFSLTSTVVKVYGSPRPLWVAVITLIMDTRFNLVMVYNGGTYKTYNMLSLEEASLIR